MNNPLALIVFSDHDERFGAPIRPLHSQFRISITDEKADGTWVMSGSMGQSEQAVLDDVLSNDGYRNRARALRRNKDRFTPALVTAFRNQAWEAARVDPRDSGQIARLGLHVANVINDREGRVGCLHAQAEGELLRGSFGQALKTLDAAERVLPEEKAERLGAQLDALRITVHTSLEAYVDAEAAGRRALRVFEQLEDRRGELRVRMALGDLAFRRDRPREALRHYRRADDIFGPDASPLVRAGIAVNRGNALQGCSRFQAAERQFRLAAALYAAAGRDHTVAQVEYNAAYADLLRGRYESALQRYAEVESKFRRLDDERHLAHVDLDRAEVYLQLNLPDDARSCARRAEEKFEALELEKERAEAAYLRGRAEELHRRPREALAHYERAERRFAAIGLSMGRVACLRRIAQITADSGDRHRAQAAFDRAADLLEGGGHDLQRASINLGRAKLALQNGRATQALHLADEVRMNMRRVHVPWVAIESNYLMGRAYARRGDEDQAVLAYKAAVEHVERYRGGVPPDEYMSAYLAGHADLYADIVDVLVSRGHDELAFEFAERAKSRALADLMSSPPEGSTRLSLRRVRYLRERLSALYQRMFHRFEGASRSFETDQDEALGLEVEIARQLRDDRLAFGSRTKPVGVPTLDHVRHVLDDETAVIEFYFTRDALIQFTITRKDVAVRRKEVRESALVPFIQKFGMHLALCEHRGADRLVEMTRENLRSLAQLIFGDEPPSPTTRRVVVVPHGVLHSVPFHALPLGDGWLADDFEISYAPSAATYLASGRRAPTATGPTAIFALPDEAAPEIEDESRRVAELLATDRLYVGGAATLEQLRVEAKRARYLHIATHGLFRRPRPMLSSIRLADGWVNLYDLYSLDIRSELVVLSTCESGVAAITSGDEVVGLVRAIQAAGARCMLGSRWRVHDGATRAWMESFYTHLRQHEDVGAAYRSAMADMRERQAHPFFWAPFFLAGRPVARQRLDETAPRPRGSGVHG